MQHRLTYSAMVIRSIFGEVILCCIMATRSLHSIYLFLLDMDTQVGLLQICFPSIPHSHVEGTSPDLSWSQSWGPAACKESIRKSENFPFYCTQIQHQIPWTIHWTQVEAKVKVPHSLLLALLMKLAVFRSVFNLHPSLAVLKNNLKVYIKTI